MSIDVNRKLDKINSFINEKYFPLLKDANRKLLISLSTWKVTELPLTVHLTHLPSEPSFHTHAYTSLLEV